MTTQAQPVAWRRPSRGIAAFDYEDGITAFANDPEADALYTTPQPAAAPEWVMLTDDDVKDVHRTLPFLTYSNAEFAAAIQKAFVAKQGSAHAD